MAKQTFTTGQVLTAAQMTSLQQTAMGGGAATAKTASYVLVAADAGTTVAMNAAGATTITVNTGLFAAGDTVFIQNLGAGACTVTAGTATVATAGSLILPQNDAGILYFTSASAAIFYDFIQTGAVSPLTTKGDLYTYSTSDARLPVGTNGYTLVADSAETTGLKWAAPSGSTLVGCGIFKETNQAFTADVVGIVTWAAADEIFDTDGFHSNTNSSRFTIPSGKGGKYLCTGTAFFSVGMDYIQTRVYVNGAVPTGIGLESGVIGDQHDSYRFVSGNNVYNLTAGDYIEVAIVTGSNANPNLQKATFNMIYLGA